MANILGKSLIERVYEKCVKVFPSYVATDDERIVDHCIEKGIKFLFTSKNCETGTDRVAEAYKRLGGYDTIINVQGDEPLIKAEDIMAVAEVHRQVPYLVICGMCEATKEEFENPNIVKVVTNYRGELLYASRAGIPTTKDLQFKAAYKQVCIYAFRAAQLDYFGGRFRTSYELIEDIELLRFLDSDYSVKMVKVSNASISVNVPEDIKKVEDELLKKS